MLVHSPYSEHAFFVHLKNREWEGGCEDKLVFPICYRISLFTSSKKKLKVKLVLFRKESKEKDNEGTRSLFMMQNRII